MNKQLNQNIWNIPIDKLMLWRNTWTKYDSKISNFYLRIHNDQFFITANSKILETFNMYQKLKGVYKEDVLILIVSNNNNEIKKLKFRIKSNTAQCLEALGCHFPVLNHKTLQSNKAINAKYRNIDEVLKYALEHKENFDSSKLPEQFENFVKLCLLDPCFPQIVSETGEILNKLKLKK